MPCIGNAGQRQPYQVLEGRLQGKTLVARLADAEGELTEIQDAVAGNAALSDALEAEGYAPEDVIGVFAGSAGTVELLIDDRA